MVRTTENASDGAECQLIAAALRYGRVKHGVDITLSVAGFLDSIVEDMKNDSSLNNDKCVFFYMLPLAMHRVAPRKRYELMFHFQQLKFEGAIPAWLWRDMYDAYSAYAPEGADIEQEPFDQLDDR
ncbi:MAG: hypothetical protein ACJ8FS_16975 [Sphingomicrobium sp.]